MNLVYKYGAPGGSVQPACLEIASQAESLWRDLAEVRNFYAWRQQEVLDTAPEVVGMVAKVCGLSREIGALRQMIRDVRKTAQKDLEAPPEITARLEKALADRREVYPLLWKARGVARKENAEELDRLKQMYLSAFREVVRDHASKGVHWLTSEAIEQAMRAADVRLGWSKDADYHLGSELLGYIRLKSSAKSRWSDITSGLCSLFRVSRPDPAHPHWAVATLRVGSTVLVSPFVLHREPPRDARVSTVRIVRERISGASDKYKVSLCIGLSVDAVPTKTGETCAITLAPRRESDGRAIVATWTATDGSSGEIECPPRLFDGVNKADDLREKRDEELVVAVRRVLECASLPGVPEWFARSAAGMAAEKNPTAVKVKTLKDLLVVWTANPWPGSELAYEAFRENVKHALHLWRWESGIRKAAERHRNHVYREESARLSERFSAVCVESPPLEKKGRKPNPENQSDAAFRDARRFVRLVAAATLKLYLKSAALKRGCLWAESSPGSEPKWTTQELIDAQPTRWQKIAAKKTGAQDSQETMV